MMVEERKKHFGRNRLLRVASAVYQLQCAGFVYMYVNMASASLPPIDLIYRRSI
jgi:hypothetical protein